MRHEFWNSQWKWPRNAPGRIFLARALCQVGATMFGDEWQDSDPGASIILDLPPYSEGLKRYSTKAGEPELRTAVSGWANTRVFALLQKINPGYELRMGPSPIPPSLTSLTRNPPSPYFTKEEWELAEVENKKEIKIDPARRSLKRSWAAINKFTDWATEGNFETYVRPHEELDMAKLRPDWWSAVNLNNVFTTCQMDPTRPLSIYCAGDKFGWIFVDKDGFLSCLRSLAGTAPERAEGRPVGGNPYLAAFEAGLTQGAGAPDLSRPANEALASPPGDCLSWLTTVMSASPLVRTHTKLVLHAEGQARFPGLSKREFDREYAAAVKAANAEGWRKGGAPRKNRGGG